MRNYRAFLASEKEGRRRGMSDQTTRAASMWILCKMVYKQDEAIRRIPQNHE